MKKLHMGWLDLNTKKPFPTILEFSILKGKNIVFQNVEIQIFKCNSTLNYSMVKNFHLSWLDLNTKKPFSVIFDFKGENH